ncbi:MAG: hypothetical protein IJU64_01035 [Bacilli bacterium]|nr:hypothetical protein [Bacilli bacterium]
MNLSAFALLIALPFSVAKGPVDPNPVVGVAKIFAFYEAPMSVPPVDEKAETNETRASLTGHCFIQIRNTSGSPMTVGHVVLSNSQSVTIGAWPATDFIDPDESGMWYNRESWDTYGWSSLESYSLSVPLRDLGLGVLNTYLSNSSHDVYWIPTFTCANFAVGSWNSLLHGSSQAYTHSLTNPSLGLPSQVKSEIGGISGYSVNASYSTASWSGYVNQSGNYVAW